MSYNGLTEAEAERLAILAEECGEVIQCVGKILRHGYSSDNNGKLKQTNRQALQREIGDLLHAIERMTHKEKDLDFDTIAERVSSKPAHILPYLHHQES